MATALSAADESIERENPTRVVWMLAWPAVALNSLQVVNTLLDRGFIGHLPIAALTAHGGATNVMFLMFSLAMALATGSTALVARAYGAGDKGEYRMASRQSLGLAIFGGVTIAAIAFIIAPFASSALLPKVNVEAINQMTGFIRAYSLGLPAIFVIQALAGALRGIGDTKSPMVISGVQILLHIILNFLLIFPTQVILGVRVPGAGMGLVGAATALSISATLAAVVYIGYVARTPLGAAQFKLPRFDWVRRILRIAIPAGTMAVLRVLSLTCFTMVLKNVSNGGDAIAAMSVGFAIESIMFMPAFGLSVAASALVGQSLGMKRPDRAERLAWVAAHYGALVTVALALPLFIFAEPVAGLLLGNKVAVIHEAATLIRYLCLTEVFFAYAMVMIGAMQGAGDTVRPLWISVFSLWGLRVPLAILLALPKGFSLFGLIPLPFALGLGAAGAWMAMASTQGVQGILSIVAFRQGAWKTKKV